MKYFLKQDTSMGSIPPTGARYGKVYYNASNPNGTIEEPKEKQETEDQKNIRKVKWENKSPISDPTKIYLGDCPEEITAIVAKIKTLVGPDPIMITVRSYRDSTVVKVEISLVKKAEIRTDVSNTRKQDSYDVEFYGNENDVNGVRDKIKTFYDSLKESENISAKIPNDNPSMIVIQVINDNPEVVEYNMLNSTIANPVHRQQFNANCSERSYLIMPQ